MGRPLVHAHGLNATNPSYMVATAFEDHQQWLASLRAMHASAMHASAVRSPLPSAPMVWGLPNETNAPLSTGAFSDTLLDANDFEEPVFRSLGGFPEGAAFEEAPVYRSAPIESGRDDAASQLQPSSDAEWLATMPPLVHRQRAHGASILLA